ncbi:helix-turn-helix transcriptional regulator [Kutzneria buriramensis]|uniref:NB-ARC domain-containing protein n=1 Tax=Kutzneria buriramensis TaxID=1045776 RepID=A0A3E0HIM2_9PSEU|nr:helix-turn-helix transcriptional regulator [Kutzneria buriramensis]REH46046.1 NB-ARC domain-containing protein [Kutzneria buriramensis]
MPEPTRTGPDPRRIRRQPELARELDLLRIRAAAGTRKAKVTVHDLAQLAGLPRSTLHSYLTGQTLVPSAVLDRIVIALGASKTEQREWSEAWYRLHTTDPAPVARTAALPFVPPARIRGFTGRANEFARLDGLAGEVSPRAGLVIAAVCGGPGTGKTALVTQWAHRCGERFPDGCLYLDLRGYDQDPAMPAADALATLVGMLAPDDAVPADIGVRAARYRSLLADRRMLVVLDNAVDSGHVRPLLPGTDSCMVVVTSRDRLGGLVARDGARRIEVGALPQPDALELLGTLFGAERVAAEPAAAVAIAESCAGLPLALRVAAERIQGRAGLSLMEAAVEIGDGPLDWLAAGGDARTDLRAVLCWSYHRLAASDPLAAMVFQQLGGAPAGSFTPVDAARAVGVPVVRARCLIDVLERAHLVEPLSPGRYRMHELLRAYATELAIDFDSRPVRGDAGTRTGIPSGSGHM